MTGKKRRLNLSRNQAGSIDGEVEIIEVEVAPISWLFRTLRGL